MIQIFRWLHEHASIFRQTTWEQGGTRTMRREITVEKEERTLMVGTGFSQSPMVCPFCGQSLPVRMSTQTAAAQESEAANEGGGKGREFPL